MFDQASGKAIVSDVLEIVDRGPIYFQNSAGHFAHENNRSMTSLCFTKQLGKAK